MAGKGRGFVHCRLGVQLSFWVGRRVGKGQWQAFWTVGVINAEKEDRPWAMPKVLCSDQGCSNRVCVCVCTRACVRVRAHVRV